LSNDPHINSLKQILFHEVKPSGSAITAFVCSL